MLLTAGPVSFAAALALETGFLPFALATADVDGDGAPDLIVANQGPSISAPGSVSVLRNHGDGTFARRSDYPVGGTPYSVVATDVDADGDADLVTANRPYAVTQGTVSVLLNDGNGSFAAKVDYPAGPFPGSVAAGDLDGDGDADLLVANSQSSGGVSVLRNNGDGTFAARVQPGSAFPARAALAADVDGDGDADLVATNATPGGSISVLRNNGDGTFAARIDHAVGSSPAGVVAADLDGDGDLDLAAGRDVSSGTIAVLLNAGDGTFGPRVDLPAGLYPTSVAAADLDGDGDVDLLAGTYHANGSTGNLSAFINNGDATFRPRVEYAAGNSPSIMPADLDGDGDADVIAANNGPDATANNVSIFRNNGDGTFATRRAFGIGTRPASVATADLGGDGDADLISANDLVGTVSVLLNDGDGTFAAHVDHVVGGPAAAVTAADLDADGDLDLATGNRSSNGISVLLNRGDGTFAPRVDYAAGDSPSAVVTADLDADGDLDLVTANGTASGTVSVLRNNGDGTFASRVAFATAASPLSVAAADLDGDGDADLITANYAASGTISLLRNHGNGTFAAKVDHPAGAYPRALAAVDLDADGDVDLAVVNAASISASVPGQVSVLRNNGSGAFAAAVTYPAGSRSWSVAAADLDGDGDRDLAVANYAYAGTVAILVNDGLGGFDERLHYAVAGSPRSVVAADLDGDGDAELATADTDAYTVSVLRNLLNDPQDIPGTAGDDTFTLRRGAGGDAVEVWVNGGEAPAATFALADVPGLHFKGLGGDDTLVAEFTSGDPILAAVSFDGGLGSDAIRFVGGGGDDAWTARADEVVYGAASSVGIAGVEAMRFEGSGGDDSLTVAGALPFSPAFDGGAGEDSLTVHAGSLVLPGGTELAELTITAAARVGLAGGGALKVGSLDVGPRAVLDVGDGRLVVQARDAAGAEAALAAVEGLIRGGRIVSSAALADPSRATGLAAVLNRGEAGGTLVGTSWGGLAVDADSVLVRFTYAGDGDLDGELGPDDYLRLDAGFMSRVNVDAGDDRAGYRHGDLNYDGRIDAADYHLIDRAFATRPPAAPAAGLFAGPADDLGLDSAGGDVLL